MLFGKQTPVLHSMSAQLMGIGVPTHMPPIQMSAVQVKPSLHELPSRGTGTHMPASLHWVPKHCGGCVGVLHDVPAGKNWPSDPQHASFGSQTGHDAGGHSSSSST
jgi:hypothetical protein